VARSKTHMKLRHSDFMGLGSQHCSRTSTRHKTTWRIIRRSIHLGLMMCFRRHLRIHLLSAILKKDLKIVVLLITDAAINTQRIHLRIKQQLPGPQSPSKNCGKSWINVQLRVFRICTSNHLKSTTKNCKKLRTGRN
jgi:hypothetical protein